MAHKAHTATAAELPALAKKLREKLEQFRSLLPPSPDQLTTFAETTLSLDALTKTALPAVQNPTTRLMEDVQDAVTTTQVILNQPLDIGVEKGVSLVDAAREYTHQKDPTSSDLARISQTFSNYVEQTHTLKVELQLTIEDLDRDMP